MIETVAREQMMDHAAQELGLDPLELRRRNVLHADDLPYTTAAGLVYDQITAEETLEQAAAMIGYEQLREQQRAWRQEGRLVGVGLSLFAEPSGIAMGTLSTEAATVRIGPNGHADVVTSSASHGQSLETTIAQVVADELGLDIEKVAVIQGDTATTPYGPGTGGSRSAVLASGAAREASQEVRRQMLHIAANQLEAAPEDLEIRAGRISVAGTPAAGVSVADVARAAAAGAGDRRTLAQRRLEALAAHFHQAEAGNPADLDAGTVVLQRLLHRLFDLPDMARLLHVDEVDDDQARHVA